MKSKLCISIILLSLFFSVCKKGNAQAPDWAWDIEMGGQNHCYGYSMALDHKGYIYATGSYADSVDFDPSPGIYKLSTNPNKQNVFVAKYDSSGNFVWARSIGGTGDAKGKCLTLDSLANIYVTGFFQGTVDFDPGPANFLLTSYANDDIFITKYDSAGNFLWAKAMGGTGYDQGLSIVVDAFQNTYVTGFFTHSMDFDPDAGTYYLTSAGDSDIFVLKLNSTGNLVWAIRTGGVGKDIGYGITVDNSSNVYTTGYFSDTVDFNPGPAIFNLNSSGNNDIYVMKIDSSGNLVWANRTGSTWLDEGRALTLDAFGNIYVTGSYGDELFLAKYNSSGNLSWKKNYYAGTQSEGYSIAVDSFCNIYYTGYFSYQCDFDPSVTTYSLNGNGKNSFISKLDSGANFQMVKAPGGNAYDIGYSIVVTRTTNNPLIIGCFDTGILTFDANQTVNSNFSSIFIAKLSICNSSGTTSKTSCFSYTSPSGNYVWTNSGIYVDTIPNAMGCDSVLTIHLQIHKVDTAVVEYPTYLVASVGSAIYQWLDCNNGYAPIVGQTNQWFIPTIDGSYAVSITQIGCTDTSSCHSFIGVGIDEISAGNNFEIFPNPTNTDFIISIGNYNKAIDITITNLTGKKIYSTTSTGKQKIKVNAKGFAEGIYFVQIETPDFIETKKLIVTK